MGEWRCTTYVRATPKQVYDDLTTHIEYFPYVMTPGQQVIPLDDGSLLCQVRFNKDLPVLRYRAQFIEGVTDLRIAWQAIYGIRNAGDLTVQPDPQGEAGVTSVELHLTYFGPDVPSPSPDRRPIVMGRIVNPWPPP